MLICPLHLYKDTRMGIRDAKIEVNDNHTFESRALVSAIYTVIIAQWCRLQSFNLWIVQLFWLSGKTAVKSLVLFSFKIDYLQNQILYDCFYYLKSL